MLVETLTPFFPNSLAILGTLSLGPFLMLRIIQRLSCGYEFLEFRSLVGFLQILCFRTCLLWIGWLTVVVQQPSIFLTVTISISDVSHADCQI